MKYEVFTTEQAAADLRAIKRGLTQPILGAKYKKSFRSVGKMDNVKRSCKYL